MKLVPAICPRCKANIKVDKDTKKTICEYCKTPILIDDALDISKLGKIEIDGIESVKQHLTKAKKYLKLQEYDKSYDETEKALKMDELESDIFAIRTLISYDKISFLNVEKEVEECLGDFFIICEDLKLNYEKYQKLNEIDDNNNITLLSKEKDIKKYIELYDEHISTYEKIKEINNKYQKIFKEYNYESRLRILNEFLSKDIDIDKFTSSIITANLKLKSSGTEEVLFNLKNKYGSIEKIDEALDKCFYNEEEILVEERKQLTIKQNEEKALAEKIKRENEAIDAEIQRIESKPLKENVLPVIIGVMLFSILGGILTFVAYKLLVFETSDSLMHKELTTMVLFAVISWIAAFFVSIFFKNSPGSTIAKTAPIIFIITYLGSYIGVIAVDLMSGQVQGAKIFAFIISVVVGLFTSLIPAIVSLILGVILLSIVTFIVDKLKDIKTNTKVKKLTNLKKNL